MVQTLYENGRVLRTSRCVRDSLVIKKSGKSKIREHYTTTFSYDGSMGTYLSRRELLDKRDSLISEVYYQPDFQWNSILKTLKRTVARDANGTKIYVVENKDTTFFISPFLEVRHRIDTDNKKSIDSLFYNNAGELIRNVTYYDGQVYEILITENQKEYIESDTTRREGEIIGREILERKYY